jgi:hypothetical protein
MSSTPIAIESNELILLTKKKSVQENTKNNTQIGKMAFFTHPEGET